MAGRPRAPQVCCSALCRREIQPWENGVEVTLFARTFGMGKRRSSKSERLFLCPNCSYRTVSGKVPSVATPVDLAFFKILLDLVGADSDVIQQAWKQLEERRQTLLYAPALTEGEVLPPSRTLKAG